MNDWNNTDTNTHYTNKLVVSDSGTGTSNKPNSSGTNAVYLNLIENNTSSDAIPTGSSHKIVGTGTVSVSSDDAGQITINGNASNVVNNDPTLAWGTKSTIGTVDGAALSVTMPANPGA